MLKTFGKEILLPSLGSFLLFWILAIGLKFAAFIISPVFYLVIIFIPIALLLSIVFWFKKRKGLAIGLMAAILLNFLMWIRIGPSTMYQLLIPFFFISE